jgi:hypothetical protein
MKVYDCFPFFNELDLLEIRLNELNTVVDYFVLVESTKSWQNKLKECVYENNKDRFANFNHKIIRIEVPPDMFSNMHLRNEILSWNYIINGLTNANDDDIIILSALDEIPDSKLITNIIENNRFPICMNMGFYQYYLNTKFNVNGDLGWRGSYFNKFKNLDKSNLFSFIESRKNDTILIDGGWHFTFLGNEEQVYNKVQNYTHSEFNEFSKDHYKNVISNLKDPFDRNETIFVCVEDLEKLPIYIQNNSEKFRKYLYL